jgi:c-di-GMP-binding flagellar brake protein YcgR
MVDASAARSTPKKLGFEQMHLQVVGRMQLVTYRTVKPIQHFSSLIGYIKDEYIIVKTPIENGVTITLDSGEKLTIRVFAGMNVCSFACTVLRIFPRPMLYLHLSFPTAIQGTSLRASMRVKVSLAGRVTGSAPDAQPIDCSLVNISVTGVLVESKMPLPADNELVTLQFGVAALQGGQDVQVVTRATIRNVNVSPVSGAQTEVFTYGMQFVDLDPAHYMLLQNLTYEALLEARQKIV